MDAGHVGQATRRLAGSGVTLLGGVAVAIACLCLLGVAVAKADVSSPPVQAGALATTSPSPPPLALLQVELAASPASASEFFGGPCAVSGDTALFGSSQEKVYVYVRSHGVWTRQATLTAADGVPLDSFGCDVALSGDTAIVGANFHDAGGMADAGAAYIFVRSHGVWTLQKELTAADGAPGDYYGIGVAVCGDTAIVGSPLHDLAPVHSLGISNAGCAYVYTRSGTSWTGQAELTAPDAAVDDCLGVGVSLSGDTALVGAYTKDAGGVVNAGEAYVFVRSGGSWTCQQTLNGPDLASQDRFGVPVVLSGDTALVAAVDGQAPGNTDTGAAYVFVRNGTTWSLQQKLVAPDGAFRDDFGNGAAMSGDTILLGAPYHDPAGLTDAGAAYMFTRDGTTWTQVAKLMPADGAAGDDFGGSIALDGGTAIVDAWRHAVAGNAEAGAAYIYVTAPVITLFAPSAGAVGSHVVLSGESLSGATSVKLNGVAATFVEDSNAQLTLTVPAGATTGPITVTTPAGTGTSATSFSVTRAAKPAIARLSIASGKRGAVVTITGSNFGARSTTCGVKFGATKCAKYPSWTGTKIKCRVPAKAKFGKLKVTVMTAGGTSNARSFTVKR